MGAVQSGGGVAGAERHGGRDLDPARDAALREAALALLAEVGYDRMTMDAVAARARAGKTTIYRRWSGKAELVVEALNSAKAGPGFPDTGSLRGDLRAAVGNITSAENRFDARVTLGMVTALARDGELREVFRERFIHARLAGLREVFERAEARGEMPKGHDLDLLASLFPAFVLQHLVISGGIPDPALAQRLIDAVILPLASAPPGSSKPSSSTPTTRVEEV